MIIGNYNTLRVSRSVDFGLYLTDGQGNEVLLPRRYATPEMAIGQQIEVFVYNDSEDRPVATTEQPTAVVGQFALMRVKAVNAVGAFLDWGLTAKDLLVPFREQRVSMQAGRSYVVRVYLDEASNRVVASAKLGRFLNQVKPDYYRRQRVDIIVVQRTEIGYRVIVNESHWGQIYQNEIYTDVNVGDRLTAFVKQVRDDGKVDLTLSKIEKMRVDDLAGRVFEYIRQHGGSISLTDKSSPEEIMAAFGCSKKDYKKALGQLYRERRVTLGEQVQLINK